MFQLCPTEHLKDPLANSFRGETVPLLQLQQIVFAGGKPHGTLSDTLRRKAIPLRNMQPQVFTVEQRDHSHEDSQWREAVQVND